MNWAGISVIAGLLAIACCGVVPALIVAAVLAWVWSTSRP